MWETEGFAKVQIDCISSSFPHPFPHPPGGSPHTHRYTHWDGTGLLAVAHTGAGG